MLGAVHTTGFAPELLYPGLKAIFGTSYQDYPKMYPKFMNVVQSDKRFEKVQEMSGFTLAGVKDEGDSVGYAKLNQGFQKEYNHTTYGIGAVISRELQEDDQYGFIRQVPKLLSQAMVRTQEVQAHATLNNGFDSNYTGADAVALFSTAHPNSGTGGGTQRNTPTTAVDLTQTSLEAAIIDIGNFRDANNQRIVVSPKTLVVPINESFNSRKILETKYKTGSADNDVNVISNMNLELVVTNYLLDTDAWFVITDAENGLTFMMRREASLDRDNDISTQNLALVTTMRFDTGWTDWRGAWGSPGA